MKDYKEQLRIAGITQQMVADELKRNRSHINRVLNGKAKMSKAIENGIIKLLTIEN
jgi:plasmid maintenance system antidote protein VapI